MHSPALGSSRYVRCAVGRDEATRAYHSSLHIVDRKGQPFFSLSFILGLDLADGLGWSSLSWVSPTGKGLRLRRRREEKGVAKYDRQTGRERVELGRRRAGSKGYHVLL